MRKLFIRLLCVVALGFASFTYANQPDTKISNEIFEIESYVNEDETVYCRWRTCRVESDGTLTPNTLTQAPQSNN